ncbi:hypothetical protein G7046_g3178 [Stylonectria norvegica]|nr:hypothetical protein G7046_g3178 [Stylonectria norvegica]
MLFEFDPDLVPRVKLAIHGAQILFAFVAWCLEIAVMRSKKSEVTGQNGWAFGVFFISIPAWIFLVMTPRFSRTRKFAQVHAMLAVDGLMIILWLSAFAAQASYNSGGKCGHGCGISKGVVGLGVFVSLLFGASTFVSAYTLTYYNFHGHLPGYDNQKIRGGENIDPDKAAFSMAPHDEEAYERVNADDHDASGSGYGGGAGGSGGDIGGAYDENARYGDANPYSAEDDDPSRYGALPPRTNTLFDTETEYRPGGTPAPISMPYTNPSSDVFADPYANPPSNPYANPPSDPYADPPAGHGYDDHLAGHGYDNQPAKFPEANYDGRH